MILNNNIQEYIQKLQEIKEKMEKELPEVDWTKTQLLEIRLAIGYIGACIYGLKLSQKKE